MHAPPLPGTIDAAPPIPFTDQEIGSAAHEKHMPSVRAIAVDPDRGLVLLNLIGADASVSAVIMELLRSKSNGVGFLPALFGSQRANIPTQLTIQQGGRHMIFRSAATTATPDPHALLGHLRAIGVVLADAWAVAVRDLALDAQLITAIPAAGITCWRLDGDLVRWIELVRQGTRSKRFPIPSETALHQQRAA